MNVKLFSLVCTFVILLSTATVSYSFDPIMLQSDAYGVSSGGEATRTIAEQHGVSVVMKQKKNVTLLAIKNNNQEPIFGCKIEIMEGNIKFVKARGWDRERIDAKIVLVKTVDKGIMPSKSIVVMVITNSENPSYEWSAFDKENNSIAKGDLEPLHSWPIISRLNFTVEEYQIPDSSSAPLFTFYDHNSKVIWISDASRPRIWAFSPKTHEFKMYEHEGKSTSKIAIGSNQRVWFTDGQAKSFGYIEPNKDSNKTFKPAVDGILIAIAVDPADNVWLAVLDKDRVVSFNPANEEFSVFETAAESRPSALLIDKSGMVWFTEAGAGKLGKLDPSTGKIVEYQPSDGRLTAPSSIIKDSNGHIWIGEHGGLTLTRFDPATLNFQRFSIPDKEALTLGMVEDNNGNIWYAQHESQYIAVLDPMNGERKEIRVPSASPSVQWLTIDEDGRIWFAEPNNAKMGSIMISTMPTK